MVGLILLSGIAASFMFDPSSRTARAKRENG
jgi:hypothetical protein